MHVEKFPWCLLLPFSVIKSRSIISVCWSPFSQTCYWTTTVQLFRLFNSTQHFLSFLSLLMVFYSHSFSTLCPYIDISKPARLNVRPAICSQVRSVRINTHSPTRYKQKQNMKGFIQLKRYQVGQDQESGSSV